MLNGHPSQTIPSSRRLQGRKGEPSSLSRSLLYADNTIVFCGFDAQQLGCIQRILLSFEAFWGDGESWEVDMISVKDVPHFGFVASILGCKVESFLLFLWTIFWVLLRQSNCEIILRLQNFAGWERHYLAKGAVGKEEKWDRWEMSSNATNAVSIPITEEGLGTRRQDRYWRRVVKVNISLAAAQARLHNAMEERDQFYEANDQIVSHLKTKEDELSRSISSGRVEADVLKTWINFLEDTWVLQCSYAETKEKQVNDELERHESYYVNLVINLLSAYKKELKPSVDLIAKFVDNLKSLTEGSVLASDSGILDSKELNPRKNLEEYVVDNMKEQFYTQHGKTSRKDDTRVKELFDSIEKLREAFESIERPDLEMENPPSEADPHGKQPDSPSHPPLQAAESPKVVKDEHPPSPKIRTEQLLDAEAELAKLESEFGKVSQDYSTEEVGDWEFDELEKELRSDDSATSK
ncbi:hypothetical protein Acr_24g0010430 [Actinidia rufa]|uniref:Uncharacterized protein n=1 Tax=Actinidia rufa TaxID=165716 RepID=A0A7J0GVM9_9ERIC|nr:hypothetical protein Acr_24g0010430 [Actinidia rufa]